MAASRKTVSGAISGNGPAAADRDPESRAGRDQQPPFNPWSFALLTIVISLSLAISGQFGLALKIPPVFTTAIWPPAGIALAVALIKGRRAWPGILIGGVLILCITGTDWGSLWHYIWLVLWPSGCLAQAMLGAWLIRRFGQFPNPLTDLRQIVRLVGLGGVANLLNASLGVGVKVVTGQMSAADAPLTWTTWWVGDTMAVFVLTPALLTWIAAPKADWQSRRWPITLSLGLTFAVTIGMVAITAELENRTIVNDFNETSRLVVSDLQRTVESNLGVISALQGFEASTPPPTTAGFLRFAVEIRAQAPKMTGFGWGQYVRQQDRAAFEASQSLTAHLPFVIRDVRDGRLVPAVTRDDYFPVVSIVMSNGMIPDIIGFDLASTPSRKVAIDHARQTGTLAMTGPIVSVALHDPNRKAFLAVLPVESSEPITASPNDHNRSLAGMAFGIFTYADMMDEVVGHFRRSDFNVWLYDTGPADGPVSGMQEALYQTATDTPAGPLPIAHTDAFTGPTAVGYATTIDIGGRHWSLLLAPTPAYFSTHRVQNAWIILLLGLLVSGFSSVFVLTMTGRGATLSRLVDVRTTDLRTSEERYRALVENSRDCIWEASVDQGLVYVSPRIADILGYTPEEMMSMARNNPGLVMTAGPDEAAWLAVMAAGRPLINVRTFMRHRNGTLVTLESSTQPVFNQAGVLTGHRGISRDISERAETEASLAGQRTRLERHTAALHQLNSIAANPATSATEQIQAALRVATRLFDLVGSFIVLVDGDGRITLRAEAWAPFVTADRIAKTHRQFAIETGFVPDDLLIFVPPDRSFASVVAPLEVQGAPYGSLVFEGKFEAGGQSGGVIPEMTEEDGEIIRLLARLIGAIIERDQRSQEILGAKALLEAILDNTPIATAIIVTNAEHPDGRITLANKAFGDLFGLRDGDWLGRTAAELLPTHEEYVSLRKRAYRVLDTGLPYQEDLTLQKHDGTPFIVRIRGKSIDLNHPEFGRSWTFLDITKDTEDDLRLIEANRALEAKARDLARSNAELEQFAYVASHDLRQPLRQVASYLGLIERRFDAILDDQGREFMGFAKRGAARMDRLIVDLLDLSRIGRIERPMGPVLLNTIIDTAVATLAGQIHERHATVTVPSDLPMVIGDRSELTRLFENLIGNAIKYCPDERDPVVTLTAETQPLAGGGREVIVTVADNGIGIGEEYFERVFGIFQRLHGPEEFEGTGIGLAICRKIVERHHGRIWLASVVGEGTRFMIALPMTGLESAL